MCDSFLCRFIVKVEEIVREWQIVWVSALEVSNSNKPCTISGNAIDFANLTC